MKIPKSFQLLGHTIEVECIAPIKWKIPDAQGLYLPQDHKILIRRCKPDQMMHIFAHELMHAILDAMSHELYDDERFVDSSGGLLAQALDTFKYPATARRTKGRA